MKTLLFIPFLFVYSMVIGQTYNSTKIIGKPIKIGKLEIAQNDFPMKMNWWVADDACRRLGVGWRLPTIGELEFMYKNKAKIGGPPIGGFAPNFYWSSTEFDFNEAWVLAFSNGNQFVHVTDDKSYVRAVRSF